jgi:hypothetical protein
MKKLVLILFVSVSFAALGQFRDDGLKKTSVKEGIVDESSGYALGFMNSENFRMKHSFSLSYSSFGGNGISLGTYTNSMFYKLMSNMNVQMDVNFMFSPYSSFGETFQKDISGVYISKAAINYYPFKDLHVSIQYRNVPYYNPYFGRYNGFNTNPFYQGIIGEEPLLSE